jgi:predicted O-methyltransferase YrrM
MSMAVLKEIHSTLKVYDQRGTERVLAGGINLAAGAKIQSFMTEIGASRTLEIGMSMGCSTLAILEALPPEGHHIAIDPYQTSDPCYGVGLEMVKRAGLSEKMTLIERPDFVALPELVAHSQKYDLILIDGHHTFDFTFIDFFYADLLLRKDGILLMDDWGMPCVYHVTRFIEEHKAYDRIGPHMWNELNLISKLNHFRPRARKEHSEWGTICAYRKIKDSSVTGYFCHSNFYPHYRVHKWWAKLRGHAKVSPLSPPSVYPYLND